MKIRLNSLIPSAIQESKLKRAKNKRFTHNSRLASQRQIDFVESILKRKLKKPLSFKDARSIISDFRLKKQGILSWDKPYKKVK